jgi:hypothetical protein
MRDVEAEMRATRSLDCGVVLVDAIAGEAIAAGAAYVQRELLVRPLPTVSAACAARYTAWRVLMRLPGEWTVAEALAALEDAPYHVGIGMITDQTTEGRMSIDLGPRVTDAGQQTVARVARYRAALAVIDEAHRRGLLLCQEDATAFVDVAIGQYVAQLQAPNRRRG